MPPIGASTLLDARIDALSDQVARQTDAVLHRLLSLEDEITAVKAGLGRLELQVEQLGARVGGVEAAVLRLDERLSRVEKRIDDLGAAEPHSALSADVQALRARVETLQTRLEALEKRVERP